MADTTTIIGIDCAVDEKNIGVAVGMWASGRLVLTSLPSQREMRHVADCVCRVLSGSKRTLIALDAPLGWPEDLGKSLADHRAGRALGQTADLLFRRETDRFVRRCLCKQPLDVGADRIARTAHAALNLLETIRKRSGREIPLAWEPSFRNSSAAIEVYPAGTLIAHCLPASGYKRMDQIEVRRNILDRLKQKISFEVESTLAQHNADMLDAIVCVLAGGDFLSGEALPPGDMGRAEKEGWIWVRKPPGEISLTSNGSV